MSDQYYEKLKQSYKELINSDWLTSTTGVGNRARTILENLFLCILAEHNIDWRDQKGFQKKAKIRPRPIQR